MDKITIYSPPDLAAMVFGAVGSGSGHQWLMGMQKSVADMVRADPHVYRTFGPWWWPIKAQLVAAGMMTGELDDNLAARITTGDPLQDMAGGVAYHGFNVDRMHDGNVFSVDTVSGNVFDYLLNDPELEALISAGN